MWSFLRINRLAIAITLLFFGAFASIAYANHSWGPYHWARTANPFNLKLGDNVSTVWDGHLATTSTDWSVSSVLDTTVVTGQSSKNCRPTSGRVEVCDKVYGNNGWLGLAQIWINSNNHIVQGVAKMNDTYFNAAPYNTPSWRQFVMCQEVGHTFGLDHQDVDFYNTNLGTCMDYTNDPDGTLSGQLSNLHPNAHDYAQLGTIYSHLDSVTTVGQTVLGSGKHGDVADADDVGKVLRKDGKGRPSLYERDLGKGDKLFTFIYWVE